MSETIEKTSQFDDTPSGWAQRWSVELQASKDGLKTWWDRGDKVLDRYIDEHIGDVIASCRCYGECRITSIIDTHRSRRTDRPVRSSRCRNRVLIDCECGTDRVVCRYVRERVTPYRSHRTAVDQDIGNMVTDCRCNGECRITSIIDTHRSRRSDLYIRSS